MHFYINRRQLLMSLVNPASDPHFFPVIELSNQTQIVHLDNYMIILEVTCRIFATAIEP